MKSRIELNVEARTKGKHFSRALRTDKKVPAVVYGAVTPVNVHVLEKDIVKYNTRAYENALYTLKSADSAANGIVVLIKTVDVHPLSRRPQHVDFYALDMKKPVRVNVEVRLEGKPAGLAEGGLLNVVARTIEVEVLPTEIPEFITADISHLNVGEALHVSDLKLTGSVKLITGADQTIATVNEAEEEAVATPAVAPAAAPAAPAKK